MAKHLTAEDRQYILRRYQEGTSLRGIAREIGRPDITVRRVLESQGVMFGPPRTSNRRSSPETEALVLRLYDEGRTWDQIISEATVSSTTVAKILSRNGRELSRKPEGTKGKEELISALYDSGHSARAIGRMLGHSKTTIARNITDNGGEMRTPGCENPDFFDVIDSPEKAYWLGFIGADGCVVATARYPEGSHLSVQLAIRDRSHLLKLKKALGAYATMSTGVNKGFRASGYASLTVGSRRLTAALLALGITPRKSATLQPWNGPAELMPHYWRGMMDGDGSIARKGEGIYTVFLCGSEACVRAFAEWAAQICSTKAKPYTHSNCWYVGISGRHQVPKLLHALYGNAPVSLERKQKLADAVISGIPLELNYAAA